MHNGKLITLTLLDKGWLPYLLRNPGMAAIGKWHQRLGSFPLVTTSVLMVLCTPPSTTHVWELACDDTRHVLFLDLWLTSSVQTWSLKLRASLNLTVIHNTSYHVSMIHIATHYYFKYQVPIPKKKIIESRSRSTHATRIIIDSLADLLTCGRLSVESKCTSCISMIHI